MKNKLLSVVLVFSLVFTLCFSSIAFATSSISEENKNDTSITNNTITVSGVTDVPAENISVVVYKKAIVSGGVAPTTINGGIGTTNVAYIGETTSNSADGSFAFNFKVSTADPKGTVYTAFIGTESSDTVVSLDFVYTPVDGMEAGNNYDSAEAPAAATYSNYVGVPTTGSSYFPLAMTFKKTASESAAVNSISMTTDDIATGSDSQNNNRIVNITRWELKDASNITGSKAPIVVNNLKGDSLACGYLVVPKQSYLEVPNLTGTTVTLTAHYVESDSNGYSTIGSFDSDITLLPPAALKSFTVSGSGSSYTLTATNDTDVLSNDKVNMGFRYSVAGGAYINFTGVTVNNGTATYNWLTSGYAQGTYSLQGYATNKYSQQVVQGTKENTSVTLSSGSVPFRVVTYYDKTLIGQGGTIECEDRVTQNGKIVTSGYTLGYSYIDLATGVESSITSSRTDVSTLDPGQYKLVTYVGPSAGNFAATKWSDCYTKAVSVVPTANSTFVNVRNALGTVASNAVTGATLPTSSSSGSITLNFSSVPNSSGSQFAALIYANGDMTVATSEYSTETSRTITIPAGDYSTLNVLVFTKDANNAFISVDYPLPVE